MYKLKINKNRKRNRKNSKEVSHSNMLLTESTPQKELLNETKELRAFSLLVEASIISNLKKLTNEENFELPDSEAENINANLRLRLNKILHAEPIQKTNEGNVLDMVVDTYQSLLPQNMKEKVIDYTKKIISPKAPFATEKTTRKIEGKQNTTDSSKLNDIYLNNNSVCSKVNSNNGRNSTILNPTDNNKSKSDNDHPSRNYHVEDTFTSNSARIFSKTLLNNDIGNFSIFNDVGLKENQKSPSGNHLDYIKNEQAENTSTHESTNQHKEINNDIQDHFIMCMNKIQEYNNYLCNCVNSSNLDVQKYLNFNNGIIII